MRKFKLIACITLCILACSACKVGRFFVYNFADITDYKKFPSRSLLSPVGPFKYPRTIGSEGLRLLPGLDSTLLHSKTVAFLVIRNDSIIKEEYFRGYEQQSTVASFSMAKSITSILIGCAISDGLIGSVDDKVTQYIPELSRQGFDSVSIDHILQMTSGLKFEENYYSPFSEAAAYYYGTRVEAMSKRMKLKRAPGQKWEYVSGNTQILGWLLQKVLKDKSITSYCQEKLWTPLGMEYDASWSIDHKNGIEKTFCCLNARARDFAKLGSLYLHKGNWQGKQVVPEQWVSTSTTATTDAGGVKWYRYQWWLPNAQGDFCADGYRGQFTYVCPRKNIVLVRLGQRSGKVNWMQYLNRIVDAM
jgi:CubicO group peptidase (beta-lactamase class C family)